MEITDSDIAEMTPQQRRELIERLARPIDELMAGSDRAKATGGNRTVSEQL